MKKAQKFTLDLEDEELCYPDLALLFFHTPMMGYAFADDLNRLYHLSLARLKDLEMNGLQWPLYRYHNSVAKLTYLLIERPLGSGPSAPHWREGHKLMIIQGEEAEACAESIHDDFSTPPAASPVRSMAEEEHARILQVYQQELMPVSRFTLGETPAPPLPKKAAKERAELEGLVLDLLDCIDMSYACR